METEAGEPLPNGEGSPSHQDGEGNKKNSSEKDEKDGKEADVEMKDASVPNESPQKEKNKEQELDKDVKPDTGVKKTIIKKTIIDKELLLAYRYFDRTSAGYIKLDALRKVLHSLGKFHSDKNLRELVLCALFESNKSPRDGKIIYTNLVKKVEWEH